MGGVSMWTEAIPKGLDVNPSCLGWLSHIFNHYASLLGLQCHIKCFDCNGCFKHYEQCFERTEVISEGLGVNPGCFGWFPNIFINYAVLLCLQCNTHENELL
jgi:hypothetical protein